MNCKNKCPSQLSRFLTNFLEFFTPEILHFSKFPPFLPGHRCAQHSRLLLRQVLVPSPCLGMERTVRFRPCPPPSAAHPPLGLFLHLPCLLAQFPNFSFQSSEISKKKLNYSKFSAFLFGVPFPNALRIDEGIRVQWGPPPRGSAPPIRSALRRRSRAFRGLHAPAPGTLGTTKFLIPREKLTVTRFKFTI